MKVLFVVDAPGWALDHTADKLIEHLPFDCEKCYCSDVGTELPSGYDRIHYMNWLDGKEWGPWVSGGVCSHNWKLKHETEAKKRLPHLRCLTAISGRLYREMTGLGVKRVHYTPNGVDMAKFTPIEVGPRPFTVGWMGQRTSGGFGEKLNREGFKVWDIKGYELILEPLMHLMKDEACFKVLDRGPGNAIPYDEIPSWYHDVDVYLCTSLWEGCPFPVLEAAASGKAIVTTDVGIVRNIVAPAFVVKPPRSREEIGVCIEKLRDCILALRDKRGLRYDQGRRNRIRVESSYRWETVARRWESVFSQ